MPLNIVFMGTPDFAVPCLERILQEGHRVTGVYCQPDRPKGRGYRLIPPPVKELAQRHGLPVHQPARLRDGEVRDQLKALAPDLIVVVAYGRILPADILTIPPLGCVNVHASLLPKLRGAAPIQWSVLNGDAATGVATMYMEEGLDTGDVILVKETPIGPEETAGELFERLSRLGADCLAETLPLLEAGTAPRTPQDHARATYAPMIEKSMAAIDFGKSSREICNLVRGMNPSPMAYLMLEGKRVRVHRCAPAPGYRGEPGRLLDSRRFVVACGDGAVELLQVQPEGKRAMDGAAFLAGKRLEKGAAVGC